MRKQAQVPAQGGQRCAQLVRNVRHKLPLHLQRAGFGFVGVFQLREHGIERHSQLPDFILGALIIHPAGKILFVTNLAGGLRDFLNWLKNIPGEEPSDRDRRNHGEQGGRKERVAQPFHTAVSFGQRSGDL